MTTNRYGKDELVKRVTALIEGIDQSGNATTIAMLGRTYTSAEARATLQSLVDLRRRVAEAKGALKAVLATEAEQMPALAAFASAFRQHLKVAHSTEPDVLAAHGIHPKVRTPPTVETQTLAVAKRAATRKARHTLGPRQKERIKGDVTGVTVTPVRAEGA